MTTYTMVPDRGPLGNEIIKPPQFEDFNTTANRLSYIKSIVPFRGYWIRAYGEPMPHDQLKLLRTDTTNSQETTDMYSRMFSREELVTVAKHIVGIEVLHDHEDNSVRAGGEMGNMTMGCVVGAHVDPLSGSLDVLIRPYANSYDGMRMCTFLEFGLLSSLSIQHNRIADYVQLCEVSICRLGKVKGTVLQSLVRIKEGLLPVVRSSSVYTIPRFLISVSSARSGHASGRETPSRHGNWFQMPPIDDRDHRRKIPPSDPVPSYSILSSNPVLPPPPSPQEIHRMSSVTHTSIKKRDRPATATTTTILSSVASSDPSLPLPPVHKKVRIAPPAERDMETTSSAGIVHSPASSTAELSPPAPRPCDDVAPSHEEVTVQTSDLMTGDANRSWESGNASVVEMKDALEAFLQTNEKVTPMQELALRRLSRATHGFQGVVKTLASDQLKHAGQVKVLEDEIDTIREMEFMTVMKDFRNVVSAQEDSRAAEDIRAIGSVMDTFERRPTATLGEFMSKIRPLVSRASQTITGDREAEQRRKDQNPSDDVVALRESLQAVTEQINTLQKTAAHPEQNPVDDTVQTQAIIHSLVDSMPGPIKIDNIFNSTASAALGRYQRSIESAVIRPPAHIPTSVFRVDAALQAQSTPSAAVPVSSDDAGWSRADEKALLHQQLRRATAQKTGLERKYEQPGPHEPTKLSIQEIDQQIHRLTAMRQASPPVDVYVPPVFSAPPATSARPVQSVAGYGAPTQSYMPPVIANNAITTLGSIQEASPFALECSEQRKLTSGRMFTDSNLCPVGVSYDDSPHQSSSSEGVAGMQAYHEFCNRLM